jgi:hypothetical protein
MKPDPTDTIRRITFALVEDSRPFLDSMFLELERGGSICIGLLKHNGSCYAWSRIAPEDFYKAVELIRPKEGELDGQA